MGGLTLLSIWSLRRFGDVRLAARARWSSALRAFVRAPVVALFVALAVCSFGVRSASAASFSAASWGPNKGGELGVGVLEGPETCVFKSSKTPCSTIATQLDLTGITESVVAVAAGNRHSLALLANGKVLAWGSEQFSDLGNGSKEGSFDVPKEVSGLSEVTAIATDGAFNLALLKNGTVKAWGEDGEGQLGNGKEGGESGEPVTVSGLSEVTAIATGFNFGLALLKNGTVKAWGVNYRGELTEEEGINSSDVPVSISGLSEVTAIAAGAESAYALLKGGTVKAWGLNTGGQLGNGTFTGPESCSGFACSRSPVSVSGLSEVTAISSSYDSVLALTKSGGVKSWGENEEGELGDGTTENRDAPVSVSKLSGVTAVAGGLFQSLALLSNGTVAAWGDNEDGELGTGSNTGPEECGSKLFPCSTKPVAVHGLAGVKGISANGISLAYGSGSATPHPRAEELLGSENPGEPNFEWGCPEEEFVNCATGNESLSQTDVNIGGRGFGLKLTRTYNDQAAVSQPSAGRFGYGWSSSFNDHLVLNSEEKLLTVVQENGSAVVFEGTPGTVGEFAAPGQAQAKLSFNSEKTYVYTLPNQEASDFNEEGRLVGKTDRNGNTTSFSYNEAGRLETVTDPAGRTLKFAYNGEGEVESVKDPLGHTVKYAYEGGNLTGVTLPGESKPRWQFKYDSKHRLTSVTDGREGKTAIEYDSSNRVISETDPAGRKRKFVYAPFETTVTNEATGSVTREVFTAGEEPEVVTHAYGTSIATSETFTYDGKGEMLSQTNGDGQTTTYAYSEAGDRTSMTDPDKNETKWTYDGTHDLLTTTTPNGETTTIERDSHGNQIKVSRPAPEEKTQETHYEYDSHGELTKMTDPLGREWKYEYDSYGDKTAEIDPEGDKRSWEYNADSQEIAMTSPRGNAAGAIASEYTTTTERDAQGRPTVVSEPQASVGKPVSRARASISGVTMEGQTLSAAPGIWEGAASLSYAYQWERCSATGVSCATISGATSSTYTLAGADVGHTIRVAVTATNSSGSASSTSVVTAVVSVVVMPQYSSQFGSKGSGAGQLAYPYGVALDSHGNVWIDDGENNRVDEFSSSGTFVEAIGWGVSNGESKYQVCTSGCRAGLAGSGEGQFNEPAGLTISGGNLYVVDYQNDRVEELNEKSEFVRAFGAKGTGAGQLEGAVMIAAAAGGNLWVSDTLNSRIEEFTSTGAFVEAIGWGVSNGESKYQVCTSGCHAGIKGSKDGEFNIPVGIGFYSGTMYIVDDENNRVQEFNEEKSEFVAKFGSKGTGAGQFEGPTNIGVESSTGHLYVSDFGDNRVEEFSSSGSYLGQFGTKGIGNAQFTAPQGIAITSAGTLYVVDNGNDRVKEWKPVGTPVNVVAPSVSGEIITGQTLTAGTGIWTASPTASYTYQWQRCNSAGTGCTNVSGATGATYTLGSGDAGYRLRVMVKATNTGGATEKASAAAERTAGPHTTEYAYDGDGNVERVIDPNGHPTHYVYDADNERTKVEEPNGTVTETSYDGAGQVSSQTNGAKHKTEYMRNTLEQVTEVIDPLSRKTTKEYDAAGNLTSMTDPATRTTTYKYDPANRLTEVSYSDGKTPTVKYEYDADGNRTKMTDGTGTNTYTYDQLNRLTETKDGHGDLIKYTYDLANEQTKITYPNGKAVERAYDKAGRLEKVTDWLEHTTKFSYNPDSKLTAIAFPTGTSEEDTYAYNNADQMTEAKMSKSAEVLASLSYARDNDGQVQRSVGKSLPGKETQEYAYDENNRLAKGAGTAYAYDAANNPTTIGSGTYKYDNASQLETGPSLKYTYNELGERTKTTPTSGPATTYAYDQAGNLTSVERSKEGEIAKIEDTYAYNGDGIRTSETITGTTHYLAWDTSEELPLILNDATNNYIYGPGSNTPIEQINGEEKAQYLHHDQEGSIRLITSSTGTVEGSYAYTPYGALEAHTGTATTALGYDSQYFSSDTGLIYLRARSYDPTTAQFMSVDPAVETTLEPYVYVEDDPLAKIDLSGECATVARTAANSTADECRSLLGSLQGTTRVLERRLRQLKENTRKYGPDKVKNYVKTFEDKQKALRKKLKRWDELKCTKEIDVVVPGFVRELSEVKIRIVWRPYP
jgi:RHS repeat-associated protein